MPFALKQTLNHLPPHKTDAATTAPSLSSPRAAAGVSSRTQSNLEIAQLHAVESKGVAVRARGLTRRFGSRTVIDALDLDIAPGEFVALIGRSGCGKSTLLRVLANLDDDIEGDVTVPQRRAVAFQSPRLMPWLRVWRNVAMGKSGAVDRTRAEAALREVGLAHRSGAWPSVLSGGEAQRAALARALIREPDLLLLDEPFGALDALTRVNAQRLVSRLWQAHGCAVLLITHDVDEALLLADRVLVMADGRISETVIVDLPRRNSDNRTGAAIKNAAPAGNVDASGAVRDTTSVRFGQLRRQLLNALGVENEVAHEDNEPRTLPASASISTVAGSAGASAAAA